MTTVHPIQDKPFIPIAKYCSVPVLSENDGQYYLTVQLFDSEKSLLGSTSIPITVYEYNDMVDNVEYAENVIYGRLNIEVIGSATETIEIN